MPYENDKVHLLGAAGERKSRWPGAASHHNSSIISRVDCHKVSYPCSLVDLTVPHQFLPFAIHAATRHVHRHTLVYMQDGSMVKDYHFPLKNIFSNTNAAFFSSILCPNVSRQFSLNVLPDVCLHHCALGTGAHECAGLYIQFWFITAGLSVSLRQF